MRFMKLKSQIILTISILPILPFFAISVTAQTDTKEIQKVYEQGSKPSETTWTKKKTTKWYKSYEWLNGLKLKPHKSIDQQEFAKQYHSNKVLWDKAFAFMKENELDSLKPGKYQIDGANVYATVTERATKDFDKTIWEGHRKYNDIHYVIKGREKFGIASVSSATVTKDFENTKDDIGYRTTKGKYYTGDQSTFFIIFPKNAHLHGINSDVPGVVKKLVIKVRAIE
jgi:biofilm protein TabA